MDFPDDREDSDPFRYPPPPKSERRLSVAGMINLVFGSLPKTPRWTPRIIRNRHEEDPR